MIGVFFGRCNLPTPGHAKVIQRMLAECDTVEVWLSASSKCTPIEDRISVLESLVDSDRVTYRSAPHMYAMLEDVFQRYAVARLYCGEDRLKDVIHLQSKFSVLHASILGREDGVSSTAVRQMSEQEMLSLYRVPSIVDSIVKLRKYEQQATQK